jgi:hypothetical protein
MVEDRPRWGDRGRTRRAEMLVLPLLGVGLVAAIGAAILTTSTPSRSHASVNVPVPPAAGANSAAGDPERSSIARGAADGYRTVVQSTRTGAGVTTLDVNLTTEGEPASAPSAHVQLTGRDSVRRRVELSIVDAGHWVSGRFSVPAGRYTVIVTFDRKGGPVVIPMTMLLT